ncbi:MAG: hypothetical protein IJ407_01575, partial [Clostridia bacterium]|nr:hypothetical protein [Clostridia bacterium]
GRFLSYNTNAYLIRSSVSMDENSHIGGCSMVVAPDGTMLVDMKSAVGITTCEIDPKKKYYKPAGFGGEPCAHYEYIEKGRRPWKYRPGGSAIVRPDEWTPYPRTSMEAPAEKTLEAIGAAVATDIQEITLPLSDSPEGILVYATPLEKILKKFSCHTIFNLKLDHEEVLKKLPILLRRYDCQKHVFLTLPKDLAPLAKELFPAIRIAEL